MDEKRKGNMLARSIYVALFLICVYPLSAGPLIWMNNHDLISDSALESIGVFYYPLEHLIEEGVPGVAPVLLWYAEFWDHL